MQKLLEDFIRMKLKVATHCSNLFFLALRDGLSMFASKEVLK